MEVSSITTSLIPEEMGQERISNVKFMPDPYPDQTPRCLLQREYLVHSAVMTVNDHFTISPLTLLMQQTNVKRLLTGFKWFKSDIRVRVQLVTNPMQYGLALVGTFPYISVRDFDNRYSGLKALSQCDPILLDVAQDEGAELLLPYTQVPFFWSTDQKNDDFPDWVVSMRFTSLEKLTLDSSASVSVAVFASFDQPHCSGFEPVAELQSRNPRSFYQRYRNNLLTGLSAYSAGASVEAACGAYSFLSGDNDCNPFNEQPKTVEPEATKLSPFGELSAPISAASSVLGDLVSYRPSYLPTMRTPPTLEEICMIPSFVQDVVISTEPTLYDCYSFFSPSTQSYVSQVWPLFRYWRGSTQILLKFIGSTLFTARVIVKLMPTRTGDFALFGDTLTWQVTVNGTTDLVIDVPFIDDKYFRKNYVGQTPWLSIQLEKPIPQSFDKPVSLRCAMFQRMCEDLQLSLLQSPCDEPVAELQARLMSCFTPYSESSCPDMFPGRHSIKSVLSRFSTLPPEGFTSPYRGYAPETVHDPKKHDLFKAVTSWFHFWGGSISLKMAVLHNNVGDTTILGLQRRSTTIQPAYNAGDGIVATSQAIWPVVDVLMPWCSQYPIACVGDVPDYGLSLGPGSSFSWVLQKAGPDFRVSVIKPVKTFVAELQSRSSVQMTKVFRVDFTCSTDHSSSQSVDLGPWDFNTFTPFSWKMVFFRTNGASDVSGYAYIGTSSTVSPPNASANVNGCCLAPFCWRDTSNNGQVAVSSQQEQLYTHATATNCRFNISLWPIINGGLITGNYSALVCVTAGWVPTMSMLANAVDFSVKGQIETTDVNVVSQPFTASVSVENSPTVSVSGAVTTYVDNVADVRLVDFSLGTDGLPVEVANSSLPISFSTQSSPLWTSLYPSI